MKDRTKIRAKAWADSIWNIIQRSKKDHLNKIRNRSSSSFKEKVVIEAEELVYLLGFVVIGVVFNPLIPFHFKRNVWQIIDVLSAISILILGFVKIK